MNANTILSRAITAAEANTVAGGSPLVTMKEKRKALHSGMVLALEDKSPLQASEQRSFDSDYDKAVVLLAQFDQRVNQLANDEQRSEAAASAYRASGQTGGFVHSAGGTAYSRDANGPSFFKDMLFARSGDRDAIDRLARNNVEARALGNTSATGGSGGEFAPPGYLLDDFIALARPGRVAADLFHAEPLPSGVSSVNLPRVLTGTATGTQTTQNSTLVSQDMTTAMLTSGVSTVGGKQVISQQLLDQSGIPFDQVVLQDLASDYARQIGTQALTGTGTSGSLKGMLTAAASSANALTWTQATPTAAGLYSQIARLQGMINSTRYVSPDTVLLSPRRWSWLASFTDSSGRPLVAPTASGAFNSLASPGPNRAAGLVGSILGMDVYVDPNMPTNLGTGANQDLVAVFVRDDVWLWESELKAEAFTAPYAESLGILVRVHGYAAMIPDRFPASLGTITGTGLVTPTFAS